MDVVFTKTHVGRQSFSVYRILYGLVLRCNHIWSRKQLYATQRFLTQETYDLQISKQYSSQQ